MAFDNDVPSPSNQISADLTAINANWEYVAQIAAGTKMLFYANTAPTGWTIDTALNDKVVFITKGSAAGGQTGGGAHSTGTWTSPSHTLTSSEIPTLNVPGYACTYGDVANFNNLSSTSRFAGAPTALAGSNHNVALNSGGNSHNHGATWRPAAYCFIVCSRD